MLISTGNTLLWLATAMALLIVWHPFRNATATRTVIATHALTAWLGLGTLALAHFLSDFSIAVVALHSHSQLPWYYKIAAIWGSPSGSFTLWISLQALAICWLARRSSTSADSKRVHATGIRLLASVNLCFLLFLHAFDNPFAPQIPLAIEGADLNPMLQHPAVLFHPPLLYSAYTALALCCAMATAQAIHQQYRFTAIHRPLLTAIGFLSAAIVGGSWWAYEELGWGGWWFWDPSENSSLMPLLLMVAALHWSFQMRRVESAPNPTRHSDDPPHGQAYPAVHLLLIAAFSAALLGTFLIRSGILSSVHSFIVDPDKGLALLLLIGTVLSTHFGVWTWRASRAGVPGALSYRPVLLAGCLLLICATATILLGTYYPLILEVMSGERISVGKPYFDLIAAPLLVAVTGTMAWQDWRWSRTAGILVVLGATLGGWLIWHDPRPGLATGVALAALLSINSRYSFRRTLAHAGMALMTFAITIDGYESKTGNFTLKVGETIEFVERQYQLGAVAYRRGPNYVEDLFVFQRKDSPGTRDQALLASRRLYDASGRITSEPGIGMSLIDNVYVTVGAPLDNGAWPVSFQYRPLLTWIWLGGLFVTLGCLLPKSLLLFDRGRRRASQPQSVASPTNQEAERRYST